MQPLKTILAGLDVAQSLHSLWKKVLGLLSSIAKRKKMHLIFVNNF
jgi:hypothetical protein